MALEQASRLGFTINGDVEESWSDFQFAWGRVNHPIGGLLLKKVFDHVAAMDADGEVERAARVECTRIASDGRRIAICEF